MRLKDHVALNRSATATAKGRVSGLARQRQKAALSAQEDPDPHIIRGVVTDQTGRLQQRQRPTAHRPRPHGTSAPLKSP